MNYFKALAILTLFLAIAPISLANVYTWTDENGVKHYSNVAPPESVKDVRKDHEIPADPSAETPPTPSPDSVEPAEQKVPQSKSGRDKNNVEDLLNKLKNESEVDAAETQDLQEEAPSVEDKASEIRTPLNQNEVVRNEKAHVKQLQLELDDDSEKREEFITSEKDRLNQVLDRVRRTPVSQFGSSRNKNQQVGYYQYRLEELQNNPDTYFEYGVSDTD